MPTPVFSCPRTGCILLSFGRFFAGHNVSTSTCQFPISVKLELSQAFVSIRPQESRVKTEDSGSPTIDLTSLARPAIQINFEGWDMDIVFTEAELPILPPPPVLFPYSSPAALQVISPPPIEFLNTDIDERNFFHFSRALNPTKCALETVGTAVQSKAKKNRRVNG
jgi:hypothetical protein